MRSSIQSLFCIAVVVMLLIPKESYCDIFQFKDLRPIEGKIIEETETQYTVKLKGTGKAVFPKSLVQSIKKTDIPDSELYTKEDLYVERLEKIDPKDAAAQLELAKWCLENSTPENDLNNVAIRHFKKAKELNPSFTKDIDKELLEIEDKEAGKFYSMAEEKFKNEEFFEAEELVFSILSVYPQSSYAGKARKLLINIWGERRALDLLGRRDSVPEIASSQEQFYSISGGGDLDKLLEAYANRAVDCKERAGEVPEENRGAYYIAAINCYNIITALGNPDMKRSAETKKQKLIGDYFETNPLPDKESVYLKIYSYLNDSGDPALLKKICERYFESGGELYKKAKRLKQPEKREKARTAYFCFWIVNNFSGDEKIKQESSSKMVECRRLERELK